MRRSHFRVLLPNALARERVSRACPLGSKVNGNDCYACSEHLDRIYNSFSYGENEG